MQYFLAKTDPETYSIHDFVKEKKTVWNGIKNPGALLVIKTMKPGDKVFIYHSQGGKPAIVGLAQITSDPRPDTQIAKSWVVDMELLKVYKEEVTLREIKETGLFDDWALVYRSRLSTMAVPEKFVLWMEKNYPGTTV
ncbi:EVE domain-containing protein [Candidatus Peregrinibacteria bacterium]|nr:EVE domain-containing protein [Candidatus Peregrinibacteria bacterium]